MHSTTPNYAIGDIIRIIGGDHENQYGKVVRVDADAMRVRVAGAHTTLSLDEVELHAKARYSVGDRVELFPDADGENGPSAGDCFAAPRYAIVTRVDEHPANADWVLGYDVTEFDSFDVEYVKSIARLAPAIIAHYFDSTGEAYDASQTDDVIRDGDVLVVEPERVVGIVVKAWPTAVTPEHGAFHTLAEGVNWTCVGREDERTMTFTICPPDAERFEQTEVFPADPGTDYSASLSVACERIGSLA